MSLLQLHFSQPVSKELVHKFAASEVFPTDVVRVSDHEFCAGVIWPRRHVFFRPVTEGLDAHLITETARQVMILISHTMYEIDFGTAFLAAGWRIALFPSAADASQTELEDVRVKINVSGVRRKQNVVRGHYMTMQFERQGGIFAIVSMDTVMCSAATNCRLRRDHTTCESMMNMSRSQVLAPATVGFERFSDVVLSRSTNAADLSLSVDFSNSILFDHPVDHIPAMVMIEACRQLRRVSTTNPRAEIMTLDISFIKLIELDQEVIVRQTWVPRDEEHIVEFIQDDRVCARAHIRDSEGTLG